MTSIGLLVILGLAACVAAWALVPYLLRRRAEGRLADTCRSQKAIVLSYDDGPGTDVTPRLMALLAKHEATATFFVLGRQAEAHPETVQSLLEHGHEVGSHTYDHTNAWKSWPQIAARDWAKGAALVDQLGGTGQLFRPPYGKLTLAGLIGAVRAKTRFGWWTLDSRDSWQRRPIDEVLADLEAAQGGVVLLHDGDGYERVGPGHADYVLELTERVIIFARDKGYRLMRLGDLMSRQDASNA